MSTFINATADYAGSGKAFLAAYADCFPFVAYDLEHTPGVYESCRILLALPVEDRLGVYDRFCIRVAMRAGRARVGSRDLIAETIRSEARELDAMMTTRDPRVHAYLVKNIEEVLLESAPIDGPCGTPLDEMQENKCQLLRYLAKIGTKKDFNLIERIATHGPVGDDGCVREEVARTRRAIRSRQR